MILTPATGTEYNTQMISSFDKLVEAAPRLQIAVVGDAMTDVYVHGHLADSQDGCQKFVEQSRFVRDGGAANAANSLIHWNEVYGSWVGKDRIVKTRFIADNDIVFRHDAELTADCTADRIFCVTELRRLKVAGILVCDYDKGFVTSDFLRQLVGIAKERNVPIVADAKRGPAFYEGCVLKCNLKYARSNYVKVDKFPDHVVTMGADRPAVWCNKVLAAEVDAAPPVTCVNHVGAGDCFGAHLLLGLAAGLSLVDASSIAYSAGRVYVQHPHNRPPTVDEVREDLLCRTCASASAPAS